MSLICIFKPRFSIGVPSVHMVFYRFIRFWISQTLNNSSLFLSLRRKIGWPFGGWGSMEEITGSEIRNYWGSKEFGVYWGATLRSTAIHLTRTGSLQSVYGFDSFQGLVEEWNDFTAFEFSTHGQLPDLPQNAKLVVGWYLQRELL